MTMMSVKATTNLLSRKQMMVFHIYIFVLFNYFGYFSAISMESNDDPLVPQIDM